MVGSRRMTGLPEVHPFFWAVGSGDQPRGIEQVDGEILGHDLGAFVVDRGEVVAIDPSGDLPVRFVNSSVDALRRALTDLAGWYLVDLDDEHAEQEVRRFEDRLRDLDPAALADGAWWPAVIEQIRQGLL